MKVYKRMVFWVKLIDGTNTWGRLFNLKEFYLMQVAKYSKGNDLLSEKLYPLCFPTFLRQCTSIIPQVKSIYWKQTYKYGVRVLNSVEEAVCINKNSGNTIWQDDMDK